MEIRERTVTCRGMGMTAARIPMIETTMAISNKVNPPALVLSIRPNYKALSVEIGKKKP
jgi:hypothetical protein